MTNLQQHHDRLAFIRRDHWRQFESSFEHEERADAAELTAGCYFDQATTGQKAAYVRALANLGGLYAPCHNRARDRAKAVWYASTADARKLFEISFEELMATGEIAEATLEAWDALPDFVDLREVA